MKVTITSHFILFISFITSTLLSQSYTSETYYVLSEPCQRKVRAWVRIPKEKSIGGIKVKVRVNIQLGNNRTTATWRMAFMNSLNSAKQS